MKRREFFKVTAGSAAQSDYRAGSFATGPEARVSLAGLDREASAEMIRSAVRAAAESATDFSWLSRGETVFIKPVFGQRLNKMTHP